MWGSAVIWVLVLGLPALFVVVLLALAAVEGRRR